jgi:DNA invertase Pin-like site-specific DNA recombinase
MEVKMERQEYARISLYGEDPRDFQHYNTALYMRFSKDDGKTGDSSSIETQKLTLEKYCKEQGYTIYDSYVDDGYTGLNFDRPGFQRLLTDIDDGKINLVITKDLSRLGRDYIQTGYYTEVYFLETGVRYIAINDGIDTLKADNDIAPFKNIMNNMYSKDLSRKVKSAKRHRALNGMFINPQAPYGYKKHPQNKNKLIIDDEPAAVVKEIFRLAVEGKGRAAITRVLNERRILIPSAYKNRQGIRGFAHFGRKSNKPDFDYTWCFATVQAIMKDRVYTGDMVNHKYEVLNYRTKKLVPVPKEKHIVVENTHEPLVSREDFERVQQLISARHTPPKHKHENIFRGILFCAECGKRLCLSNQNIKSVGGTRKLKSFYRCMNHYNNPDECAHYNYIYYDDLYIKISLAVKNVVSLMKTDGAMLEAVRKRVSDDNKYDKVLAEKDKLEKRLSALKKIVRKLYEDYTTEALDSENYQTFLADYQCEQKVLNERLAVISKDLGKTDDYETNLNKLRSYAAVYADNEALTAEILNQLVERIEISRPIRENGKPTQEIHITYRFINTTL